MRYAFKVYVKASGRNVHRAYANLRRKLLPLDDWADTDEAYPVDDGTDAVDYVPEEEIQAARVAHRSHPDGKRVCRDPQCDHGVIIDHLPVCMMTERELRKLPSRLVRIKARLERLRERTSEELPE